MPPAGPKPWVACAGMCARAGAGAGAGVGAGVGWKPPCMGWNAPWAGWKPPWAGWKPPCVGAGVGKGNGAKKPGPKAGPARPGDTIDVPRLWPRTKLPLPGCWGIPGDAVIVALREVAGKMLPVVLEAVRGRRRAPMLFVPRPVPWPAKAARKWWWLRPLRVGIATCSFGFLWLMPRLSVPRVLRPCWKVVSSWRRGKDGAAVRN